MEQAEQLLAGLGGAANIIEIEPCITRLRIEVKDPLKLNEDVLAAGGAKGVVKTGRIIQLIVGAVADNLAADLETLR